LNKARENVKIKLYRLIENLQLDDKYSILDKLHADEKFRINFNQIHTQDVGFYSVSYKNNYATVDSYIPILGKRGIMNFVALEMGTEDFPVFQEAKYPVKYTGLIVDARHLKGAKPSLFPRIKTDDGLDIYSQYLVNRDYAIEQGLALFQIDPMHAMEDKRVGNKPYFVVANSVSGEVKTNFSIATVDAVKLLSHPETRKNLKMCKVIILLPGRL
ncbi:MAG: hypothetical protein KDK45_24290, partial [Leptospiraceae bacterium]|nr:hypothetical protein [Leptospiraceae bacterium]